MILRRLARHLKAQNWIAVALEFVIVISGVVIGFQITAWNETRQERASERAYMVRLLGDIDRSIELQADTTERMREQYQSALAVAQAFETGEPAMGEEAFARAVGELGIWMGLKFITATLTEMRETGNVALIRSEPLREEIALIMENHAIHQAANANTGRLLLDYMVALDGELRFTFAEGTRRLHMPVDQALADPEAASKISMMAALYGRVLEIQLLVNADTLALREALIEAMEA